MQCVKCVFLMAPWGAKGTEGGGAPMKLSYWSFGRLLLPEDGIGGQKDSGLFTMTCKVDSNDLDEFACYSTSDTYSLNVPANIVTTNALNSFVTWESDTCVSQAQVDQIDTVVNSQWQELPSYIYGYDGFIDTSISVNVVGWAVKNGSLLEGSTEGLDI